MAWGEMLRFPSAFPIPIRSIPSRGLAVQQSSDWPLRLEKLGTGDRFIPSRRTMLL